MVLTLPGTFLSYSFRVPFYSIPTGYLSKLSYNPNGLLLNLFLSYPNLDGHRSILILCKSSITSPVILSSGVIVIVELIRSWLTH